MITPTVNYLQRTSPESQGIASAAVLQFVEAVESQVHELHSFMLLRHGKVVAEGWWSPYARDYPHMLFSLSKSFASSAIGLAVAEGRLTVDDLVLPFFPDEAPAEVNEYLAALRVRHLLSMSTGQDTDSTSTMVEQPEGNWIKGFFAVPVVHEPGTHFVYNSGATYMLSAIIQKVTGQKLVDYLKPRLFEPLGIENPVWDESPQGINTGGWGLHIRTEDIARFGQMYLQQGRWGDQQILSEAWVAEATSYQIANGDNPESDWNQGYGYQFWRCRHNAYRGDGAFGQYCIVMPEQDAVLAITSGLEDMQQPLNLVWDILLPALSAAALPEDAAAHAALTQKLTSLRIAPVQGAQTAPALAQVSGKTYRFDANELNLETLMMNGSTFTIQTARGEEAIACGYGTWQAGRTTLFNDFWMLDARPIVTSGAWTADDTFTMVIRLVETPFFHTVIYHFTGDEVRVEIEANVSFGPLKKPLIVARVMSSD